MVLLELLTESPLDPECTVLCTPDDPSTPFATPLLALVDTVRALMVVATLSVLLRTPWAISKCRTSGQRARFIAFALFAVAVMIGQAEHLGDYPSVRLPVVTIAVGYSAYGVWAFRRETPSLRPPPTGRHAA